VEIANGGNQQSFDALAAAYAKTLGVPATAGSDIHSASDVRADTAYGVYLDKKMETIADYVNAVLNNAVAGLKIPPGRFDLYGDEKVILPVDIRDKEDRSTGKDIREFLGLLGL